MALSKRADDLPSRIPTAATAAAMKKKKKKGRRGGGNLYLYLG
jgi:hypothetical protein